MPIKISRNLIGEVAQEVNVKRENRILQQLPRQKISELGQEFINTPIIQEGTPDTALPDTASTEQTGLFDDLLQTQPTVTQVPVNPPQVQPTVTQNNPQSMLPFLSGNPIDALKNLEILQRLRGTNPPPQ